MATIISAAFCRSRSCSVRAITLALLAFTAWLSIPLLPAQNPTATLVGTIQDSTGAVIPAARLEIKNTDNGETRNVVTNAGSKGTHLGMTVNLNQPYDRSAARPAGIIPYPSFGSMNYFTFQGNSIYQGATVTWQRRFVHGFFYTANYTYSKSIDEASTFQSMNLGGVAGLQNVRCLQCDRGRSDWDRGHMFTMDFSWQAPFRNRLVRGWQFAGTSRLYTGNAFTPVVNSANLNLGEAIRPNRIGTGKVANPNPGEWFNPADFPVVRDGAFGFGNAGRGVLDAPGRIEVNLSLYNNFVIQEKTRLQVRWEVFNVMNHANFGPPANAVNAPNAGTLLSADAGRVMQLGLRLTF